MSYCLFIQNVFWREMGFQRADDADAPGERDFGQTDETGIF